MDAVERFADEVVLFQDWLLRGTDHGEGAVREALFRLIRLYLLALELPRPWSSELEGQPDAERVDDVTRSTVAAGDRFPFDYYGEVFDPTPVPPEPPVVASLSDDLADIYQDVATGLREYRAGRRAQAVWEWGYGFQTHWGEHATGAIRVLHCWLAANAPNRLAAET